MRKSPTLPKRVGGSTNPVDRRTLKPNAREVFALRPRHSEESEDGHGRPVARMVTDPWPDDMTVEHLQGAVVQAGWRR